jgi:hypothetical protein
MSKKCVSYSSSFKAKVALAAVRQEQTISQIVTNIETVSDLSAGLADFIHWYNNERVYSTLSYKKQCDMYFD